MKRKYLNTLLALSLLAALAGFVSYWERRKSSQAPKIESSPQEKIFPLQSSHVQSVTFRPRDGEAFTCVRGSGGWAIVNGGKLAADQSAVSTFLDSLTTASLEQTVDPHPANLKDFGLDPPAEAVEISSDAKPEKFTLRLGDESPTGGSVYAQVAGNPRVFTLASYLRSSLSKSLFDLRDKRAVSLEADQIQRIEVEAKAKRWTLVKNPEGVWDLVLPPPVRADRITVDGLVDRLRSITMQTIVAEDRKNAGQYGFGSPELRVQLTGTGGTQTLVLGKKDKDADRNFAMNSALAPVFTLGGDFLTQFQKEPADLREKDLFSFSAFDVKRVEIQTAKGHRVFEQQKDKWKQTAPAAKDVASEKMSTLLSRLRDLRADSFPKGTNLAAIGLTKPAYRFKVQFGEKNQAETVEAAKVGEHVYARRTTDALAAELSKSTLDEIEKALNDL